MIFIILCFLIVAFFVFWTVLKHTKTNKIIGEVLALLIVLSTAFMVANLHWHIGMSEVKTITYVPIYSAQKNENVILEKPIGTVGDKAVIYNKDANSVKPTVAKPIKTTNIIKSGAPTNNLKTTEKNWEYSNHFLAFMFAGARQKELIHKTNVFNVKSNVKVLPVNKK